MSGAVAMRSFGCEEHSLRGLVKGDGLLWLVAKDVCAALGISNHRDAVSVLDEDDRDDVGISDAIGRMQSTMIISEAGVYTLAVRCQDALKEGTVAWRFRRWLTRDVLPAIRKTGRYELPTPHRDEDDGYDEISREADEHAQRRQKLTELKEIRLVFGPRAARKAWLASGLLDDAEMMRDSLPVPVGMLADVHRSVADWMAERVEPDPGNRVMSQELYDDYVGWATGAGLRGAETLGYIAFSRVLTAIGIEGRKGRDGRKCRVGLQLRK